MAELASCTIYIKGIATTATETDVRDACSKYGNITDVAIPEGKDFCFVEFAEEVQAQVGAVSSAARSDRRGQPRPGRRARVACGAAVCLGAIGSGWLAVLSGQEDRSFGRHTQQAQRQRSQKVAFFAFGRFVPHRPPQDFGGRRSSLARWCHGVAGRLLRALGLCVQLAAACVVLVGAPLFFPVFGRDFFPHSEKPISSSPAPVPFDWRTDAAPPVDLTVLRPGGR